MLELKLKNMKKDKAEIKKLIKKKNKLTKSGKMILKNENAHKL